MLSAFPSWLSTQSSLSELKSKKVFNPNCNWTRTASVGVLRLPYDSIWDRLDWEPTVITHSHSHYGILTKLISIASTSISWQQRQSISLASFLQYSHLHQLRLPILICNQSRIQGEGGRRGGVPPIFCNHLVFFAITLKNYKLCYSKLN